MQTLHVHSFLAIGMVKYLGKLGRSLGERISFIVSL